MKFLLIISLLAFGLSSCSDSEGQLKQNSVSFDDFHRQFMTDSLYQLAHIQFPLNGLPTNPPADLDDYQWQKSDWQIQRRIDPERTGFHSRFEQVSDGFVIEIIIHENGRYAMERRFARLSENQWMLIYYAALHPVQ